MRKFLCSLALFAAVGALVASAPAPAPALPKDEKKALAWFSLAADRADRQATFALGMFRFNGRGGLPKDRAEAAALLEKAAKADHIVAAYNLAIIYASLGDNDSALEWLEKAYEDRSTLLIWIREEPLLDELRSQLDRYPIDSSI